MPALKPQKSTRKKNVRDVKKTTFRWRYLVHAALLFFVIGTSFWTYMRYDVLSRDIGKWALVTSQSMGFSVQDVAVDGRVRTAPEDILEALNTNYGRPLFDVSPTEAQKNIEALPWVFKARVKRVWPDTIQVTVEEKEPLAIWQEKSTHHLIDQHGTFIPVKNLSSFQNLLVTSGANAPAQVPLLIENLDMYPAFAALVKSAKYLREGRWNLYLDNKIEVKLPDHDVPQALERLVDLEENHQLSEKEIVTIDLRSPEKLVIRMTPRAAKRRHTQGQDI